MKRKHNALPALLLALAMLLAACADTWDGSKTPGTGEDAPFSLTVRVTGVQNSLDPAKNTGQGGETVLYHLFENLLRWVDGGDGWAVMAPGQAESWEAETDYAGNTTYTFTLREGLRWSDGVAVTAGDFVTAWRRLADPANSFPHRELMTTVAGYGAVQETGDPSLLAVSAPDERTFVVSLSGSSATFLAQVCAGAYTMPVRADLLERAGWGITSDATVTNGPYTLSECDRVKVALARSDTYYDRSSVGPEQLVFIASKGAEVDYAAFPEAADLISALPSGALGTLAEGDWTPDPVSEVYAVLINTQQAPFDDPDVRLAFLLAVDPRAVTEAVGDPTVRPAAGLVPYGVADYCQRPEALAEDTDTEPSLPIPGPDPVPASRPYWDFRAHSLERVTVPTLGDYEEDCQRARTLLAQAGYAGGEGFPPVEYIYVDSGPAAAAARSLQAMWREQLGVTVTVRALSQEAYDAMVVPAQQEVPAQESEESGGADGKVPPRTTGVYALAGYSFSVGRWDASTLLSLWHSGDGLTGYESAAFDILLDSAASASSTEAWDAYLHDAEAVLLSDAPAIPLYCRGSGYLLGEGLTGLYRMPDGTFFLSGITRGS